MSDPSITVSVDPTNPGQFFACCGLLELADRLWPGAEGWFSESGREFQIACGGTLSDVLHALVSREPVEWPRTADEKQYRLPNDLLVQPLIAPIPLLIGDYPRQSLVLDGWMTVRVEKGEVVTAPNPPWNFWSGQQKSIPIWNSLRQELQGQLSHLSADTLPNLFTERLFQKGRFGFDPGPAWNALDVGFSPNEQGIEVESSAAVELLAAVGLQRFRPVMNDDRDWFEYCTWHNPLPPSVAAAAMNGGVTDTRSRRFRGSVVSRGSYSALGFSFPLRQGASDE